MEKIEKILLLITIVLGILIMTLYYNFLQEKGIISDFSGALIYLVPPLLVFLVFIFSLYKLLTKKTLQVNFFRILDVKISLNYDLVKEKIKKIKVGEILLVIAIILSLVIIGLMLTQVSLPPTFITTTTTTLTTTTTILPCILSNPVVTTNCTRDCCLDDESVFISAELNRAPSCSQSNVLYINFENKDCKINFSSRDLEGIILDVNISLPYEKIFGEWKIPEIPSKCLGKTVEAQYASLWKGSPREGVKISQTPDPKVLGNITFCAPKKITRSEEASCPLEYGDIICFYERVVLPFYNPNENISLENIQAIVPILDGEIISKLSPSLQPNQTKVLILKNLKCPLKEKPKNVTLRWVCGEKFYETKFGEEAGKTLTQIIEIENVTSEAVPAGEETYPLHPTLDDCEKLKTHVKNFCYGDVAELTENVVICEKIFDDDIKKHCVARVTLNSEKCSEIKDSELKKSCLDSVEMKKRWLNETEMR